MLGISAWRNSIFGRLFLMFILVVTPIFFLGYGIFDWGISSVKHEVVGSMQTKLNSYLKNIEIETQRIKALQYNLISNPELSRLSIATSSTDAYRLNMDILAAQRSLEAVKTSSRFIREISVIIPSIDSVITSSRVWDMSNDDRRLIATYPSLPRNGFQNWNGKIVLNLMSPEIEENRYKLPTLFVKIELSTQAIDGMLSEMQIYAGGGAFLYGRQQNIEVFNGVDGGAKDEIIKRLPNLPSHGMNIMGVNYLVTSARSSIYDLSLVQYTPEDMMYHQVNQYRSLFYLFACISFVIICIFSYASYRFVHRPLSQLVKAFRKVELGETAVEITHRGKDEFRFIYYRFNAMIHSLNSLIQEVYLQKMLVQRAELKQLQAQINPHFLYNSFFTLQRWMKRGYAEDALQFAERLGRYFQYVTRNSSDEVTLDQEVEHARIYSEIQAVRFSSRIRVRFEELPEAYRHFVVPRLILQPLIENAFEHALEAVEEDGLLLVTFGREDEFLVIAVEDNGSGVPDDKLKELIASLHQDDLMAETTAMINISRRLRLKFGVRSGVSLSMGQMGGLRVSLHIDLRGSMADVQPVDRG